jgi:hypothetical protein
MTAPADEPALQRVPIPARPIDAVRADLHQSAADAHAVPQHLAGHRAGSHAHRRLARRGAAAAAIVADAVFQLIGEIGMSGSELRRDRRIVPRTLIDVVDLHGNRRSGGYTVEHAGQDADLVRLLPLRGEA